MRLVRPSTLLVFLVFLASQSGWAKKPRAVCVAENIVNANARVSADDYHRPNARELGHYERLLGATFRKIRRKARVWFDSGGGYGVAGLESALKEGIETHV